MHSETASLELVACKQRSQRTCSENSNDAFLGVLGNSTRPECNEEMPMIALFCSGASSRCRFIWKSAEIFGKRHLRLAFISSVAGALVLAIPGEIEVNSASTSARDDSKIVAALDTEYQAAVKSNDATVMDRVLADDFLLVTGSGKTFTKVDLLAEARSERFTYEHQEDSEQAVRVWGDTAVVTAKLWGKGTESGKQFDRMLWFSDIYVRTPTGWRYVFGQVSLPLPKSLE
jgi:ketosteroid isomerase-like protein